MSTSAVFTVGDDTLAGDAIFQVNKSYAATTLPGDEVAVIANSGGTSDVGVYIMSGVGGTSKIALGTAATPSACAISVTGSTMTLLADTLALTGPVSIAGTTIATVNDGPRTITVPSSSGASTEFVLANGIQTITGAKTFTRLDVATLTATVADITDLTVDNTTATTITAGSASIGTLITTSSQIGGSTLTADSSVQTVTIPAVGTSSFVMTAGDQTISGAKTFTDLTVTDLSAGELSCVSASFTAPADQTVMGVTTLSAPGTTARRVTIPDPGANSSFVLTAGTQTLTGETTINNLIAALVTSETINTTTVNTSTLTAANPTFSGQIVSNAPADQMLLGTTVITAPGLIARMITIPDVGADASIVMTAGAQTFVDAMTFSSPSTFSASSTFSAATNQIALLNTTLTAPGATARVITIPDVGADSTVVMTGGAQTIDGAKTFSGGLAATTIAGTTSVSAPTLAALATTNQCALGVTTLTAPGLTARTITIPDVGVDSTVVMLEGAQTLAGAKTFSGGLAATTISATTSLTAQAATITAALSAATISGTTSITTPAVTLSAATNQARLLNTTLTAPGATARTITLADPGADASIVTTAGAQTIGGAKTFSAAPSAPSFSASAATNQIALLNTTLTAPGATARVITIPDVGADSTVVMLAGAQTLTGAKTFSGGITSTTISGTTSVTTPAVTLTAATNQIVMLNSTITAPGATARTFTIPDSGASASFVMTAGAQTIGGAKTFSAGPIFSVAPSSPSFSATAATNQLVLLNTTITAPGATARTFTIPDSGASASFVMTEGTATIGGAKTFSTGLTSPAYTATATTNQCVLGSTTVTAPGLVARTVTIPDAGAASTVALATNTATAGQTLVATSATAATWQTVSGGGSGVTTMTGPITAIDGNGASISGTELSLHQASGTSPGIMMITAQTFAGLKTFNDGIQFVSLGTPQILDVYESTSFSSVNVIGAANGSSYAMGFTITTVLIGRLLTISVNTDSTATNFNNAGTYVYYNLPTRYSPVPGVSPRALCKMGNGAIPAASTVELNGTQLRFYANINTTTIFSNSAQSRIYSCTFSMIIA